MIFWRLLSNRRFFWRFCFGLTNLRPFYCMQRVVGIRTENLQRRVFLFYFFFNLVYNAYMRIWAKLMTDGRIRKQFVYENPEKLTYSHFFDYMIEICQTLDIPTPVLTKTHVFNFAKFNHVKFLPRDFVESLGYDHLFIENLI
jgi:hypothetical protein